MGVSVVVGVKVGVMVGVGVTMGVIVTVRVGVTGSSTLPYTSLAVSGLFGLLRLDNA